MRTLGISLLASVLLAVAGCKSAEPYRYWHNEQGTFFRANVETGIIEVATPTSNGWKNLASSAASSPPVGSEPSGGNSDETTTKDGQVDR